MSVLTMETAVTIPVRSVSVVWTKAGQVMRNLLYVMNVGPRIVTGYGAGCSKSWNLSPGRGKISFFSTSSRPVQGLTHRLLRTAGETDHSPPTTGRVKNMWIYNSTPPYVHMATCLISQAQGNFYFLSSPLLHDCFKHYMQSGEEWRLKHRKLRMALCIFISEIRLFKLKP
jgi:hypothetical protein